MREQRQKEAVQAYLESDGRTIINAAPRFGKIKVAIDIMRAKEYKTPLIVAPRKDIFTGWVSDLKKWEYEGNPTFSTFASIKKIPLMQDKFYDFLIIDEPHELSANQQISIKPFVNAFPTLGLTGTMTSKTSEELFDSLNLDTCYRFSIDEAVDDGILADYDIFIHRIPLDTKDLTHATKGKRYTEKGYFDLYTYIKNKAKGKEKYFFDLKLISIIQNSQAKLEKTRQLLGKFHNDRILVFCGTTEVADNLGIPVYHSKSRESEIFNAFCKGVKYDQLATIKMMQAGITISPIHKGIINYTSGNPEDCAQKICRFLGFEYANPDKKAEIHIISSNEEMEIFRLKTALLFFNQSKIQLCV